MRRIAPAGLPRSRPTPRRGSARTYLIPAGTIAAAILVLLRVEPTAQVRAHTGVFFDRQGSAATDDHPHPRQASTPPHWPRSTLCV